MSTRRANYFSTSRVEAYTDAVFAIAATLLVLDLSTTAFGTVSTNADMWAALGGMWENLVAFVVSFVLLSMLWVVHLQQFRDIRRVDGALLWLNNARLLFIVLIPFTTSLVADYSQFYAGRILLPINFFIAVALGVAMWGWASAGGGRLLTDDAKEDARDQSTGGLVAVGCGILTIALSPWLGSWAFAAYALNGPITGILRRRGGSRRHRG